MKSKGLYLQRTLLFFNELIIVIQKLLIKIFRVGTRYSIIVPVFLLNIIYACNNEKEDTNKKGNFEEINIISIDEINGFVPYDSIFKNITLIPLETNEYSLIKSPLKTVIRSNYIIIQNYRLSVLVFDLDGKYIRKIGNIGKGPSEYIRVLDFDVDDELNIHICDGFKIQVFNFLGEYLNTINLKVKLDRNLIYPEQIVFCKENGYYIWKTLSGSKIDEKQCLLYKVDNNLTITNSYYPAERRVLNNPDRFHRYSNYHNIDPPYGIDTIFAVDCNGIYANYFIDFGKYTLPKPIPKWDNFSQYRSKMAEMNYATSIYSFIETDDWVYFRFSLKRQMHNVYYSKITKRCCVSKPNPDSPPHKSIIWKIDGEYEGEFFTLIEPSYLLSCINNYESLSQKNQLTKKERLLFNQISKIPISNNPVLIMCEPR